MSRFLIAACLVFPILVGADEPPGRVEFQVVDPASQALIPARMHVQGPDGKPRVARDQPAWAGHFTFDGTVALPCREPLRYEVERGPEFEAVQGSIERPPSGLERRTIALKRIANMAEEGWWSGDLHVHRPPEEMRLLMRAEDLHVAPDITWWNARNYWDKHPMPDEPLLRFDGNRVCDLMAGEDEREGGALLYFGLKRPLAIASAEREFPSPLVFVEQARKQGPVWIDAEKPFWWDVPVWLALGAVDSIGLANNHMTRSRMFPGEAWGRPRDPEKFPEPLGNGYYSQDVYYHVLNAGLRIPPSAGSASGVLPNPVGYNRVYVFLDGPFSYDAWWEGLRAGRSFVTNGPLLRVEANGHTPGHVYKGNSGESVTVHLTARLDSRDSIRTIEIIRNGRVERSLPGAERKPRGSLSLGDLTFDSSGWFLVRAITDRPETFRFASTAPFYVEVGDQPRRISRESVQFFLDWVRARQARVKLDQASQREEVLAFQRRAEAFWQARLAQANAE